MNNGFIARQVMFEATPGYITTGYIVEQYHEGKRGVEQFVSDAAYKDFCQAICIIPTMIEYVKYIWR